MHRARPDPVQMRTIHICAIGTRQLGTGRAPAVTVRVPETDPTRSRPPEKRYRASPSTQILELPPNAAMIAMDAQRHLRH